jgi:hypothetical protein
VSVRVMMSPSVLTLMTGVRVCSICGVRMNVTAFSRRKPSDIVGQRTTLDRMNGGKRDLTGGAGQHILGEAD